MRRPDSLLAPLALAALAAAPAQAQWATTTLGQARQRPAATVLDGKAFFAGGREMNTTFDVVDIYDSEVGPPGDPTAWTQASLSTPRTGVGATAVDRYAMFAGGNVSFTATTAVVDVYDSQTGLWSTAMLSQARTGIAATTVGDLAIFAGGGYNNGSNVVSDRVDIYDASVGPPSDATAWSVQTLTQARIAATAASAGGLALFAGGGTATGTPLAAVDVYDSHVGPPSDPTAWSATTLSEARMMGVEASATAGARIFFAGGSTSPTTVSDRIDIYDSETGLWTMETLSAPRGQVAATALGNTVLFAGGNDSAPSDVVDVLNAGTDTFGPTMQLSQARYDMGAASVDGKALFAGGQDGGAVSAVVDIYQPVGINYCAAGPNSTGSAASIHASGSDSLAANDLTLIADGVPNQPFIFFHAANQIEVPFGNGLRCAGGDVVRLPAGLAAGNVATTVVDLPSASITAPGQRHFQCWFRDPAAGGAGYDTSDALTITFIP